LNLEPRNQQAYIDLASAHASIGDIDKAIEVVRQGLLLLPQTIEFVAARN